MSTPHPTVQYFADTVTTTFPLILVIGREPNTDRPIANTIGPYDFRNAPYCAFWNTSYAMLGRIAGHKTRAVKQACITRRASPLIYADALPHGLLNAVADKHSVRSKLARDQIAAHVDRVFSHRSLLDRVQLIIMSGLQDTIFIDAKKMIREHARSKHIRVIEVPFFYGTNTKKIDAALTPTDRDVLQAIWDTFEESEERA